MALFVTQREVRLGEEFCGREGILSVSVYIGWRCGTNFNDSVAAYLSMIKRKSGKNRFPGKIPSY